MGSRSDRGLQNAAENGAVLAAQDPLVYVDDAPWPEGYFWEDKK